MSRGNQRDKAREAAQKKLAASVRSPSRRFSGQTVSELSTYKNIVVYRKSLTA